MERGGRREYSTSRAVLRGKGCNPLGNFLLPPATSRFYFTLCRIYMRDPQPPRARRVSLLLFGMFVTLRMIHTSVPAKFPRGRASAPLCPPHVRRRIVPWLAAPTRSALVFFPSLPSGLRIPFPCEITRGARRDDDDGGAFIPSAF